MDWIKEFNKKYANESIDVIGDDDMKLNDTYSVGSKGVVVKFIQECMNEDYFMPSKLVVDGIFGSKTKDAVVTYQKRNGLTGSGIVDKTTMYLLIKQFPTLWDKLEANWAYGER
jgi:peptidoglycan hydrolase-like protein with peptidoglycan-binding domain